MLLTAAVAAALAFVPSPAGAEVAAELAAIQDPFAALKPLYRKIEAEISPRLDDNDSLGALEASKPWVAAETDARALGFLLDIRSSYLAAAGLEFEARVSMARSQAVDARARPGRAYDAALWAKARREVRWQKPEDVIRRAAKTHSVLMFSEAHHVGETRAFGAEILPLLKELGFTVLAMEALTAPVPENATRVARAVSTDAVSGYYLMEPQLAGLVREARRLGFRLVAYEDETTDGGDRELIQAQNLYERVFRAQPDAKVVVWAGYGHIYKRSPFSDRKLMAERLWELTGREPYCLFQVFDALDPLGGDAAFYQPLVLGAAGRPRRPMVLEHRRGLFPALEAVGESGLDRSPSGEPSVDGYIVHPPFAARAPGSLRPAWVSRKGLARVEGTASWTGGSAFMIQAIPAAEGARATPADQMLLDAPGPFELHLRPGDYLVRARDASGKVRFEAALSAAPGSSWPVVIP
jgi:hypothetical protein